MGCLGFIGESLRESSPPDYWGGLVAKALHEVNTLTMSSTSPHLPLLTCRSHCPNLHRIIQF